MGPIRLPFLIVALLLMALVVLTEAGYGIGCAYVGLSGAEPPGLGISCLALLDGLLLFAGLLILSPLLISHGLHSKVQGIATLVASVLVILAGLQLIVMALAKLFLMVGLLLAFPFGTIAYLAKFADFDRGTATFILGGLMMCKLGFAVCLLAAHQGFLKNLGLILLILTSLLANVVVGFLHGMVPGILVSITDAVAAIVVVILAIVWSVILLVGAVLAIVMLLSVLRAVAKVPDSVVPGSR